MEKEIASWYELSLFHLYVKGMKCTYVHFICT